MFPVHPQYSFGFSRFVRQTSLPSDPSHQPRALLLSSLECPGRPASVQLLCYQMHCCLTLWSNVVCVMVSPCLAQTFMNKTPLRFRSGFPITRLQVSSSLSMWPMKSHRRTMESTDGAPSMIRPKTPKRQSTLKYMHRQQSKPYLLPFTLAWSHTEVTFSLSEPFRMVVSIPTAIHRKGTSPALLQDPEHLPAQLSPTRSAQQSSTSCDSAGSTPASVVPVPETSLWCQGSYTQAPNFGCHPPHTTPNPKACPHRWGES